MKFVQWEGVLHMNQMKNIVNIDGANEEAVPLDEFMSLGVYYLFDGLTAMYSVCGTRDYVSRDNLKSNSGRLFVFNILYIVFVINYM